MRIALLLPLALTTACSGDDVQSCTSSNCSQELITAVSLTMTPSGGGAPIVAEVVDPDGDGGDPPMIDTITLTASTTYAVTVSFQNRLETPPEEITEEVRDEAVDHQIFFTGDAVNGPASDHPSAAITHAYADMDDNGLPIGLSNTFMVGPGPAGNMNITLRHMPPINGQAVKTADAAATVKASGLSALGGENDANVTFPVVVTLP